MTTVCPVAWAVAGVKQRFPNHTLKFARFYFTTLINQLTMTVPSNFQDVSAAVGRLYDTYPFPPEPMLDEPPPGYNWRWNWNAAYHFCYNRLPDRATARILDAGCGSGVSTEYLVHLNPQAQVTAIDISAGTLAVARERCQRSGADRVEFHHLSLYNADQLTGEFDLINSVGVLHHLPDPIAGIQALAKKLAPGGLFHIFVYSELGRREVLLMQKAIALLQGDQRGNYQDGVAIGRKLFANLPKDNRLVLEDQRRWAMENHRDANFADMYVHPQEFDYNIDTLFELIDASGLEFVGFSNPEYWDLSRLIGTDAELCDRAAQLSDRERYRLVELLDPELSHYEFFLARPPFQPSTWADDTKLQQAKPQISPCLQGWPSRSLFDANYQITELSETEFQIMQAIDAGAPTVQACLERLAPTEINQTENLNTVRQLVDRQLILLAQP